MNHKPEASQHPPPPPGVSANTSTWPASCSQACLLLHHGAVLTRCISSSGPLTSLTQSGGFGKAETRSCTTAAVACGRSCAQPSHNARRYNSVTPYAQRTCCCAEAPRRHAAEAALRYACRGSSYQYACSPPADQQLPCVHHAGLKTHQFDTEGALCCTAGRWRVRGCHCLQRPMLLCARGALVCTIDGGPPRWHGAMRPITVGTDVGRLTAAAAASILIL